MQSRVLVIGRDIRQRRRRGTEDSFEKVQIVTRMQIYRLAYPDFDQKEPYKNCQVVWLKNI